MCIIILNVPEVELPKTELENSFNNNSHGGGLAWVEDEKVKVWKIVPKQYHTDIGDSQAVAFEKFYAKYQEIRKNNPKSNILVHCRISTGGGVNLKNCHPFEVSGDTVFAHNGSINIEKSTTGFNDTWHYNEKVLKAYYKEDPNFIFDKKYTDKMYQEIGHSKLVFLTANNEFSIVGENRGAWRGVEGNKNWYSNMSYERGRYDRGGVSYNTADYYQYSTADTSKYTEDYTDEIEDPYVDEVNGIVPFTKFVNSVDLLAIYKYPYLTDNTPGTTKEWNRDAYQRYLNEITEKVAPDDRIDDSYEALLAEPPMLYEEFQNNETVRLIRLDYKDYLEEKVKDLKSSNKILTLEEWSISTYTYIVIKQFKSWSTTSKGYSNYLKSISNNLLLTYKQFKLAHGNNSSTQAAYEEYKTKMTENNPAIPQTPDKFYAHKKNGNYIKYLRNAYDNLDWLQWEQYLLLFPKSGIFAYNAYVKRIGLELDNITLVTIKRQIHTSRAQIVYNLLAGKITEQAYLFLKGIAAKEYMYLAQTLKKDFGASLMSYSAAFKTVRRAVGYVDFKKDYTELCNNHLENTCRVISAKYHSRAKLNESEWDILSTLSWVDYGRHLKAVGIKNPHKTLSIADTNTYSRYCDNYYTKVDVVNAIHAARTGKLLTELQFKIIKSVGDAEAALQESGKLQRFIDARSFNLYTLYKHWNKNLNKTITLTPTKVDVEEEIKKLDVIPIVSATGTNPSWIGQIIKVHSMLIECSRDAEAADTLDTALDLCPNNETLLSYASQHELSNTD